MHELSLALEVIDVASREAVKNHVTTIVEIRIEVGKLSGVDAGAFLTALEISAVNTILGNAKIILTETTGKGKCAACDEDFEMPELYTSCPGCGKMPSEIISGREFRVVSMLAE